MNRIKLHVRKGDNVEVISGNFKGSSGKVLEVIARKQRVLIEGIRLIKRHLKKSQDNPQGKIAEREGPIHISNVRVLEKGERAPKGKSAKKEPKPKGTKAKSDNDKGKA
jgi:large subunit ribosomal protein L24